MQRFFLFISFFILITTLFAQSQKDFIIKGEINGIEDGEVILATHLGESRSSLTAKVTKGKFSIRGTVESPMVYHLSVTGKEDQKVDLFIENSPMRFTAIKGEIDKGVLLGSHVHDEYREFEKITAPADKKLAEIYPLLQNRSLNQDSLHRIWDLAIEDWRKAAIDFIRAHPGSFASPYILLSIFPPHDTEIIESLYALFSEEVKNGYYGTKVKNTLVTAKRVGIGQFAPDFSQPDSEGKSIQLSSFKGNYLLVDFWGSWCVPCREENPFIVKAYDRFKDKGLNILSVSLDKKKENWLKAIDEDKLTWTHVGDLKGWNNEAAKLYAVSWLPMNFLLDKEGKIIAKNIKGKHLEKKLEELIK